MAVTLRWSPGTGTTCTRTSASDDLPPMTEPTASAETLAAPLDGDVDAVPTQLGSEVPGALPHPPFVLYNSGRRSGVRGHVRSIE